MAFSLSEEALWQERERKDSPGTLDFLLALLSPGDTVVEVGAKAGLETVALAARVGPTGHVEAFESHPLLWRLLERRMATTSATGVKIHKATVGEANGVVLLPAYPLDVHAAQTTDCVALDACALDRVVLLKIDAPGTEAAVLRGGRRTITDSRPSVWFPGGSPDVSWRIVEELRDRDYRCFYLGRNRQRYVLCLPAERQSAVESALTSAGGQEFADLRQLTALTLQGSGEPMSARQVAAAPPKKSLRLKTIDRVQTAQRALHRWIGRFQGRRLVRESELFDPVWYREQVPQLPPDADLVAHYLDDGWRQGLDPSPFFRTRYYLETYPDVASGGIHPFIHYLESGRLEGRRPNPYFDSNYYAKQFPRLRDEHIDPLLHYLRVGERRGARPSPGFDPRFYLRENPDARCSMGALEHFLRRGEREGRRPRQAPQLKGPTRAPLPVAPTDDEWLRAEPHRAAAAVIDVIVPVYAGFDQTLRCIHRVLTERVNTPFELVVIDDASPDPTLSARLAVLASRGLFTYLRNERNLGFVRTVNRGMQLHPDRDVVLLNSDTEVYNDWLDRLSATVAARPDAGTLAPLSNSATICSYPLFDRDNDIQLEVSLEALDRLTAVANAGRALEIPTAVGFCMYIRRRALDAVGLFDAERFGRGYGEENDFCRRALKQGWRNYLAADVFVRHVGGTSFGAEKQQRVEKAQLILDELHPDYRPAVMKFAAEDPVRIVRQRLDLARLRRALSKPSVALISHNWGGGAEQHVQEIAALAAEEGVGALIIRPATDSNRHVVLSVAGAAAMPNLPRFDIFDQVGELASLLRELGVRHLHGHHLVGLNELAPDWIVALAHEMNVQFDYTIHDYTPICPRITLIDDSGRYCGEPDVGGCEQCVDRSGSPHGKVRVGEWRTRYRSMLARARRVYVPDIDVAARLGRQFGEIRYVVRPHPEVPAGRCVRAPRAKGDPLRVAIIGAIGPHKGHHLLIDCANDARERNLPLEFVVVGYTADDQKATSSGIAITGAYDSNEEVVDTLERVRVQVALFPAVWPETYSYTLSVAMKAGLFPVAFDLGAIATRLRAAETGLLLPAHLMSEPEAVNDALVELASGVLPEVPPPPARRYQLADYYDDIFAS